jgi:hypothetical protein
MNRNDVVLGTATWVAWWTDQRKRKLREKLSDTMTINPFLLPIIFELHNISDFGELSDFLVGSHLMIGHSTGFGKLIDEKILPQVFGTEKLTANYRRNNYPFINSCFNEIDHVIHRTNGDTDLLSLKSSRWTIQLTMAMQLNHAFNEIITSFGDEFSQIGVGVFYGRVENLTDKYDILRGINRGAQHNVVDLTDRVSIYAGRDFWTWLNNGVEDTQDWILEGIEHGISRSNPREEGGQLLESFNQSVSRLYQKYVRSDGTISWDELLRDING